MEDFEISTELSAGKKDFKVVFENLRYTLIESGSIVAVIKQQDDHWTFTQGSYTEEDAKIVGNLIEQHTSKS